MAWVMINKTTNSGKQLFRCTDCGHEDPAPTKHHVCEIQYMGKGYIPTDDKIIPLLRDYWVFGSMPTQRFMDAFFEAVKCGRLVPKEE